MAAARPLFTNQCSTKPDIAVRSPLSSRIINTYTRPSVVNYALTPKANRFTCSPIIIPTTPFNYLAPQNRPVTSRVLCSSGSAGLTNPIEIYKQFYIKLRHWCDKQSLPVGGAVYTIYQAFEAGVYGFVVKFLCGRLLIPEFNSSELEQIKAYTGIYYPLLLSFIGNPFYVARSFAIYSASFFGTPYVLNRMRGKKEDLLSSNVATNLLNSELYSRSSFYQLRWINMARGFVSAVMFLLVSGMRSPKIITIVGVMSALLVGSMFKLLGGGSKQPQTKHENKS